MSFVYNAHAKINLGLDVIRRRDDGYHEVKMIMQTLALNDVITVEKIESGIVVAANSASIPCDEHNLAYKAAKLLMDEFSINEGIKINIEKNIPVAAGMAGGSTDAAAAMKGVNDLFNLSLNEEELMKRSVKIGADVPYCIMEGTALSEGIGEVLTRLACPPDCKVLIAKPPIDVSTKFVYENLHANCLTKHPDIDGMVTAINEGNLNGICERMENVLETVTVKEYPIIDEIKKSMKKNGAINSLMSGSGPTVFGIFTNEETAKAAYINIKKEFPDSKIILTELYNRITN